MTMTLASLSIRPIRSIRRTDNFIHDLTSRVSIRQLHLIIVKVTACIFRPNKYVHAGGEGVLPYMGNIGMCRCEGYGFQAVYSSIGYINQSVWSRIGYQFSRD